MVVIGTIFGSRSGETPQQIFGCFNLLVLVVAVIVSYGTRA